MKICFPVQKDDGMASAVYGHFGSAPLFIMIDTETGARTAIQNRDQHHTHGACNPMKALDNHRIDSLVVGGIGAGALSRLNQMGIIVHRAEAETIQGNLDLLAKRPLPVLTLQGCCGGHSADGQCAH